MATTTTPIRDDDHATAKRIMNLAERDAAIRSLQRRANAARDLADTLERRIKQFADDSFASMTDQYCWAINEIENFTRNLDYAELARHAAMIRTND